LKRIVATLLILLASNALALEIEGVPFIRQDEISRIQAALETKIVTEKLKAYGLTPGEIEQKLQGLSDGQIHMLAQASDPILAGGDALGVVIAILVIVLLVILILKLSDKTVVVK